LEQTQLWFLGDKLPTKNCGEGTLGEKHGR